MDIATQAPPPPTDESRAEDQRRRGAAPGRRGGVRGARRSHDGALRFVARSFVRSEAVAEEVVQDTWLAVVRGLDAFEERSSLKTWIFNILVNRARTRAVREARTVPFSTLAAESEGPTVDPSRFGADDHVGRSPRRLATDPEHRLLAQELRGELLARGRGAARRSARGHRPARPRGPTLGGGV